VHHGRESVRIRILVTGVNTRFRTVHFPSVETRSNISGSKHKRLSSVIQIDNPPGRAESSLSRDWSRLYGSHEHLEVGKAKTKDHSCLVEPGTWPRLRRSFRVRTALGSNRSRLVPSPRRKRSRRNIKALSTRAIFQSRSQHSPTGDCLSGMRQR
jgi:hypothetical protein